MSHVVDRLAASTPAALGPVPSHQVSGLPLDHPAPGRWWRHGLVRLVVFIVIMTLTSMAASAVASAYPMGRSAENWYFATLQLVATCLAYAVVCWLEGRRRPVELAPRRFSGVLVGLALGTLGMLLVFALAVAFGARTIDGFSSHVDWQIVYMAGLVAGVSEEIIFRGVLYRILEGWFGTWAGTVLSGAVFGLVHITNPEATWAGAIGIALEAGVMFALLYALTRSLWVVMGLHAAWNVVQGPVLGSAISGATKDGEGLVVSHAAGPELLSGGIFGLEGSVIAMVVWLAFSVLVAVRLHRRGLVVPPFWVRRRRATEAVSTGQTDQLGQHL